MLGGSGKGWHLLGSGDDQRPDAICFECVAAWAPEQTAEEAGVEVAVVCSECYTYCALATIWSLSRWTQLNGMRVNPWVANALAAGQEAQGGSDRWLPCQSMRLFTLLSADEADQAVRGVLRGDFSWVNALVRDEAEEDAVWVSIEMPDVRLARSETDADPRLGYREFLVPSRITNLHQAEWLRAPS